MYYDDEARRFNFISGLLFGAVLGVGVALLASPAERLRRSAPAARLPPWRKKPGKRLHRIRDRVSGSVSEVVATGRKYLG